MNNDDNASGLPLRHQEAKQPQNAGDHRSDRQQAEEPQESWFDLVRQVGLLVLVFLGFRTLLFEAFNIPSASMIPTLQIGDMVFVSKFSYGYSHYSLPLSPDLFSGRVMGRLPHRGDVAVFRYTQNDSVDYIKRIVGLPGDHIKMVEGRLYINGEELPRTAPAHYEVHDESGRLLSGTLYQEVIPPRPGKTLLEGPGKTHDILKLTDEGQANNTPEYVVPQGCFFAMGDDRDDSSDSRFQGGRETGQCAAPSGSDYLQLSDRDLGFVPLENLIGRAEFILFSVDMHHPAWAFWYWPAEIRWSRIFHGVK